MQELVFASSMSPDKESESRFLLMAESIRAFAGSLSQTPIYCFMLEHEKGISKTAKNRLSTLNVALIRFKAGTQIPQFPFMRKVFLSAYAESIALNEAHILVWMDNDTMVLQEPKELILHDGKSLGCRPVHITNIGSFYDKPLDLFWTLIYRYCNVAKDHVFPMTTHVDGNRIRPYFNAGLLAARPEKCLLQMWRDNFLKTYKAVEFGELLKEDERYAVYMHQAVLAGTILSTLRRAEIEQLPPTYNYPLHLHSEDATKLRPSRLEELTTFRYEDFFENPEWKEIIPADKKLRQWIAQKLL